MTPNLMWYAGWFVLAIMLGGILVCVAPIVVGPMLDLDRRTKLGRKFGHAAMFAYGRAVLVRRKHGGHALKGSKFDSEKEAEQLTIGGEKKHFEDPNTVMQLLENKKFACAYERSEILTSPKLADIGRAAREFRDGGHHSVRVPVQDPETGEVAGEQTMFSTVLPLDVRERMVDLADAFSIAPGSLAPGDAETAEEYTKISQQGFQSADLMTTIQFLTAYGVGALAAYMVVESGHGGGGFSGVGLPTGGMTLVPVDLLFQVATAGVVA